MQITEEQLDSFIALYKKEFGKDISRVDALRSAQSLIRLMGISVVPFPIEKFEE
jgi:hypothetical protein